MDVHFTVSSLCAFLLNLGCHVFILLLFLTFFFFLYVSKATASHVDSELHDLIEKQTLQMMQSLDAADTAHAIRWQAVNVGAAFMLNKSQGVMEEITQHNGDLYQSAVCVLIAMAVCIGILTAYCLLRGIEIRLKFLMLENVVIFAFVGMIEIYFFLNIASKYVPVLPDEAMIAVKARLQYWLNQQQQS